MTHPTDRIPPTVPITLEPMERRHVSDVVRIERACFPVYWSESAFLSELDNRCARYVVASLDGEAVGFAGMWVIMDEAHITTVAVVPEQRGRKIGEQLLVWLIDVARGLGARRATLEVRVSNRIALRMYEKYGFKSVGIRKGYYVETGEDAVVMWVDDLWSEAFKRLHSARKRQLEERLKPL